MTIAQRIELRRLGYTKEEISELAEMEKAPTPDPVEVPEEPVANPEPLELEPKTEAQANTPDISTQLLSAINNLTNVLQNQKLNNTPQPETHIETANDIFNNILKG